MNRRGFLKGGAAIGCSLGAFGPGLSAEGPPVAVGKLSPARYGAFMRFVAAQNGRLIGLAVEVTRDEGNRRGAILTSEDPLVGLHFWQSRRTPAEEVTRFMVKSGYRLSASLYRIEGYFRPEHMGSRQGEDVYRLTLVPDAGPRPSSAPSPQLRL